jgi:hypothetical protein
LLWLVCLLKMICCWDRLVRAVWACICACKESFELFRFVCLFVLRVALVCLLWLVCLLKMICCWDRLVRGARAWSCVC